MALDRDDRPRQPRQDRGLVARPGADLEHAIGRTWRERGASSRPPCRVARSSGPRRSAAADPRTPRARPPRARTGAAAPRASPRARADRARRGGDLRRHHALPRAGKIHRLQLIILSDVGTYEPCSAKPARPAHPIERGGNAAALRLRWRREGALRALRHRDVPHARRVALSRVPVQDRLLRVVSRDAMDTLPSHIDPTSEPFRTNSARMERLVSELARAPARRARGRRRQIPRAASRAGQAPGPRAHRAAARSRLAVPRALAARRLGHVRQRGAGGRTRHRHRPRLGARSPHRRQRRDGQGRHLLSRSPSRSTSGRSRSRSTIGCRASISSTPAARSCRSRPRSFPTASTSAASSTTRRACPPSASRRSRSSWDRARRAAPTCRRCPTRRSSSRARARSSSAVRRS